VGWHVEHLVLCWIRLVILKFLLKSRGTIDVCR
jgi:hypothetical protein